MISGIMWREEELLLALTQEEAWELLSRCLNSTDADNDISKTVLKKLAKVLQGAQLDQLPQAA
jgi:hypothetical protein